MRDPDWAPPGSAPGMGPPPGWTPEGPASWQGPPPEAFPAGRPQQQPPWGPLPPGWQPSPRGWQGYGEPPRGPVRGRSLRSRRWPKILAGIFFTLLGVAVVVATLVVVRYLPMLDQVRLAETTARQLES